MNELVKRVGERVDAYLRYEKRDDSVHIIYCDDKVIFSSFLWDYVTVFLEGLEKGHKLKST